MNTVSFQRRFDYSQEGYASLGRFLVSAAHLDDVMGRCSVKLTLDRDTSRSREEQDERAIKVAITSSISRLKEFKAIIDSISEKSEWFDELFPEVENLFKWRNAVFHGRFSRGSCDSIRIEFFDKASIRAMATPPERCVSHIELDELSQQANEISYKLHERFLSQ